MKHLLIPASALLLLIGCSAPKSDNTFTINGTVNGAADGEYVIASIHNSIDGVVNDTVEIHDGHFTFTGEVAPYGGLAYITYGEESEPYKGDNQTGLYFSPGVTEIAFDKGKVNQAIVSGSRQQEIDECLNKFYEEYWARQKKLRADYEQGLISKEEYDRQAEAAFREFPATQAKYVAENPDTYWAYRMLLSLSSRYDAEKCDSLYTLISPELKADDKELAAALEACRATQPGKPAPELKGHDPLRDIDFSLADLKGKYVVIDFWATWCKGCVMGLPHIKELYDKYHDKGLEVLAMSSDYEVNVWKQYMESHDMKDYYNILVFEDASTDESGRILNDSRDNRQSCRYNVTFIPRTFLIGPDGNIIGDLEGEDLDKKLVEIFGE